MKSVSAFEDNLSGIENNFRHLTKEAHAADFELQELKQNIESRIKTNSIDGAFYRFKDFLSNRAFVRVFHYLSFIFRDHYGPFLHSVNAGGRILIRACFCDRSLRQPQLSGFGLVLAEKGKSLQDNRWVGIRAFFLPIFLERLKVISKPPFYY